MQTFKCGLICLMLVLFSKRAHAALPETNCTIDANCTGSYEVCDTNGTSLCICDTGYSEGTGSTCKKDCGNPTDLSGYTFTLIAGTHEGEEATVACATGYNEDSGTPANVTCTDGSWTSPTGCTIVDCDEPPDVTGYKATKDNGTTYGETASVVCDTGNGWNGTATSISCDAEGLWTTSSGCSQSEGSGATCGNPTASAGYIPSTPGSTEEGDNATVSCDTANGYTGTAANITCQANGSWTAYSGCSENSASENRQNFSLVILIGLLVIALM